MGQLDSVFGSRCLRHNSKTITITTLSVSSLVKWAVYSEGARSVIASRIVR